MRYVLIGIMLAAGAVYAQDTYRWTDKDGKVYYGANPPKGAIDPKKVANRVSSAVAPSGGGSKAGSGSAAPKAAPFQTVVKESEDRRKVKTDSDKAPR
jgi:hypothetical protein